jgi:hypothetical protein
MGVEKLARPGDFRLRPSQHTTRLFDRCSDMSRNGLFQVTAGSWTAVTFVLELQQLGMTGDLKTLFVFYGVSQENLYWWIAEERDKNNEITLPS